MCREINTGWGKNHEKIGRSAGGMTLYLEGKIKQTKQYQFRPRAEMLAKSADAGQRSIGHYPSSGAEDTFTSCCDSLSF